MTPGGRISEDGRTMIVHVPMTFERRGGRKVIIAPEGAQDWAPPATGPDNTMVKALARAHRWKRMLESGQFPTVGDLAESERINPSYVSRILRLNQLAPDIVEAILDGRQPATLQLADLLKPFPCVWEEQGVRFGFVKA